MSRKYKIRDQSKLYFVTFTVIQWLDVFTRQEYRDIFLDSILSSCWCSHPRKSHHLRLCCVLCGGLGGCDTNKSTHVEVLMNQSGG